MDQATKLRQMMNTTQKQSKARVIAVTSGKGGVGKTSLSVNLAIELSKLGKKVVIFDADFGLANVEVMLGIRPKYNLLDLFHNNMNIEDIITNGPNGIGFISSGSGVSELASMDYESLKQLINEMSKLDRLYDIVIIDTGAGITDAVMEFVMVSPEILLVVTPEPTSITDAYSLLKVLRRKEEFNPLYKTINVVSNRVSDKDEGRDIYNKMNTVSSKFLNTKLQYLGEIIQDKSASMAIIEQKPVCNVYPNSMIARGIVNIAANLANDNVAEDTSKDGIAKVFFDFLKSRRKNKR